MRRTPPLAFIWKGASCTLENGSSPRSSCSSVSSPPTCTNGRAIGKHEVAERLLELLHRDLEAADGLRAHAADVRAERHRRGPDVAALVEGLARAGGARVGEHVLVRLRADARRALHLGEALVL